MIGRECKCGNAFSLAILIDRGLDLENEYLVLHYLVLRLQLPKKKSGDDNVEETPVPIPNTEVKLHGAENTWRATAWEDR